MQYMFEQGFLGTKAPFFMDFTTFIVALLPLLVGVAISFAKKKSYSSHASAQSIIFVFSVLVVVYFEYGVRLVGGYEVFSENITVSHNYLFIVLVIHIFIAVITLGIWASTLMQALKDYKSELPGKYSVSHKKAGFRTFIGITLTALSGIWVYLLLFVF